MTLDVLDGSVTSEWYTGTAFVPIGARFGLRVWQLIAGIRNLMNGT